MPTVIDSLLVTLGLDSSGFDKSQKKLTDGLNKTRKAAADTTNIVAAGNKKQAESFRQSAQSVSVLESALKFGLGFLGVNAVKNWLGSSITSLASLGDMSKNLGMTAGDLAAWSHAAKLAGGSAEGMVGFFQQIQSLQVQKRAGESSPLMTWFSRLRVDLMDIRGEARPALDVVKDFLREIDSQTKQQRSETYSIGKSLGLDDSFLNLALRGSEAVADLVKKGREQTNVSEEMTSAADKERQAMVNLGAQLDNIANNIIPQLLPAFEQLNTTLGKLNDITHSIGVGFDVARGFVTDFFEAIHLDLLIDIASFAARMPGDVISSIKKLFSGNKTDNIVNKSISEIFNPPSNIQGKQSFTPTIKKPTSLQANLLGKDAIGLPPGLPPSLDVPYPGLKKNILPPGMAGIPNASNAKLLNSYIKKPSAGQQVSSRSIETNINEIKVYTAATDAVGIAGGIKNALNSEFIAQSDRGLS
jgi:hypothetical protein